MVDRIFVVSTAKADRYRRKEAAEKTVLLASSYSHLSVAPAQDRFDSTIAAKNCTLKEPKNTSGMESEIQKDESMDANVREL